MDWNNAGDVTELVGRLCLLERENEWVEFKASLDQPDEIGEYISCLANSAALVGQEAGFLVWGVHDKSHQIIGTTFDPNAKKVGKEDLAPWLGRLLDPAVTFAFHGVVIGDRPVVVLRVDAAMRHPVTFKHEAYIRDGSYKKKLNKHPELQRRLWKVLDSYAFEAGTAKGDLTDAQAVHLIDYPSFFELHRLPLPESRSGIVEALEQSGVLRYDVENQWQVTNLGALLYGREFGSFAGLQRKAIRVIHYSGTSRVKALRERTVAQGYAAAFETVIGIVADQLPQSEVIEKSGLRMDELLIPRLAFREIIANALIHQDLTLSGAGPMVEIFDDRIEITNPGEPMIDPLRFIDSAPRSRNERLAGEMRLAGICEERGSGWDKVTLEVELHQLPPPRVDVEDDYTRVCLFAPKALGRMDRPERIRAVYQHACLMYVSNQTMNNASVRRRFGILEGNKAHASRLIKEAVDAGLIVAYDPGAGPRRIRYVPFWAAPAK